jgi:hypothetical protein
MLIGIGISFISGASPAWIKDALHAHQEDDRYRETVARTAQYRSLAMLCGGLGGGFLGMQHPRITWIVAGGILLCASLVAFTCMREERSVEPPTNHAHGVVRRSIDVLLKGRGLVWAILAAMSFGLVLPFNHFWSPFFDSHVGPLGRTLMWIPINVSTAFAAYLIRRSTFAEKFEARLLVGAMLLAGVGLALIGCVDSMWIMTGFLVMHEMGRGAFFPLLEVFTQRRVESAYRATYGSLQSLLTRIGYVAVLGLTWAATNGYPWDNILITSVWICCGSLLMLAAVLLFLRRPPAVHP